MAENRMGVLCSVRAARSSRPRPRDLSKFASGWNVETKRSQNLCGTPSVCAPTRTELVPALGSRSTLYSERDISSEQMEETRQLCERIEVVEKRLKLTIAHLDDRTFELTYEFASYGFDV